MNRWLQERLQDEKSRRQSESLWRCARALPPGSIDLGSNDYLGLSRHPQVLAGAREAIERCGGGARASRLLGGDHDEVRALESELASWKSYGQPNSLRTLVFSSGYAANIGAVTSLAGRGDWLLCDKRSHASLIDGARLAEAGGAHARFYGSLPKLRALLQRARSEPGKSQPSGVWIATDTVFSMDGDIADVRELARLARAFDAGLILDDAHGSGVLGSGGRGAAEAAGLQEEEGVSLVTVGTLSKALGSQGGFVTARPEIIEWLINAARPFIYSTGIAPAACGAARAALQVLAAEPERLQRLHLLSQLFASELSVLGFHAAYRGTPIVPVLAGQAERALSWSAQLQQGGVWCPPVRPPTVALNTSRLRASLRADLSDGEMERALAAFEKLRGRCGAQPST